MNERELLTKYTIYLKNYQKNTQNKITTYDRMMIEQFLTKYKGEDCTEKTEKIQKQSDEII